MGERQSLSNEEFQKEVARLSQNYADPLAVLLKRGTLTEADFELCVCEIRRLVGDKAWPVLKKVNFQKLGRAIPRSGDFTTSWQMADVLDPDLREMLETAYENFTARAKGFLPEIELKEHWQMTVATDLERAYKDSPDALREHIGGIAKTYGGGLDVSQLAKLAVAHFGDAILHQVDIRSRLCTSKNVQSPKFHAGKSSARKVVEALGYDARLAGEAMDDDLLPQNLVKIRQSSTVRKLHDYQKEVATKLRKFLDDPNMRACMVSMPTGAGKTYTVTDTLRAWLMTKPGGGVIYWVCDRNELCEQAASEFEAWGALAERPSLNLIRLLDNTEATKDEALTDFPLDIPTVIVTTIQRLERQTGETLQHATSHETIALVFDEAHKASAETYSKCIESLRKRSPRMKLVGLSATPFRGAQLFTPSACADEGTKTLIKQFDENLVDAVETLSLSGSAQTRLGQQIEVLQKRGVLAKLEEKAITTSVLISAGNNTGAAGFNALNNSFDVAEVREAVLAEAEKVIGASASHQLLIFAPQVDAAEFIALRLGINGIAARAVSSNTPRTLRLKAVADFKQSKLRVLCNADLLTTGFDAPKITHIIVARLVESEALYLQMVGRGLRGPENGGTDKCTIIDVRPKDIAKDIANKDLGELGYERFWRLYRGNGF